MSHSTAVRFVLSIIFMAAFIAVLTASGAVWWHALLATFVYNAALNLLRNSNV